MQYGYQITHKWGHVTYWYGLFLPTLHNEQITKFSTKFIKVNFDLKGILIAHICLYKNDMLANNLYNMASFKSRIMLP